MPPVPDSHFPLSDVSSRRRRLAIALSTAPSPVESEASPPDAPQFDAPGNEIPFSTGDPKHFADWLQSTNRITWLFTGDSLSAAGRHPARGGTAVSYLVRTIRDRIGRQDDAFVTTTRAGQSLKQLLAEFDNQIARFSPDVVVLNCGLGELEQYDESLLEFERLFRELLNRLHQRRERVVVCTPPAHPFSASPPTSNQLVRLEAIRACTKESAAILVDHWSHWEQFATEDWYRSDGVHPGEQGAIELARLMIQELQLDRFAGSVPRTDEHSAAVRE